jgi:hypothetical protein
LSRLSNRANVRVRLGATARTIGAPSFGTGMTAQQGAIDSYLDLHPEVVEALAGGRPVVALESTAIALGLPRAPASGPLPPAASAACTGAAKSASTSPPIWRRSPAAQWPWFRRAQN